LVSPKNSGKI